jgi:hypothetical protein
MNWLESLNESRPTSAAPVSKPVARKVAAAPAGDLSEARGVYFRYLAKLEELKPLREYAKRVVLATNGSGRTPVKPLATMGTGGGCLLCDHCGKSMILEGGPFNGRHVADVWGRPDIPFNYASYISGGMTVHVESNGTLRIYHGYDHKGCCRDARAKVAAADAAFTGRAPGKLLTELGRYLREELPTLTEQQRLDIISDVCNTLYSYDPGNGVNRPG